MTENHDEKYILCVGMCVLDIIHICGKYPQEDSDLRSKFGRWQRGGNASNNCTVLRQFGTKCEYLGIFSTTNLFKFVIDDCLQRGISISNCVYHDCEVPMSSVILSEETGSRTIIHTNPNVPILTFEDFDRINLNDYKWIHFEARNRDETSKMMASVCSWNNKQNKENQITISLDLENIKFDNIILTQYADIVFLGKDFAMLKGSQDMTRAVYDLRKNTRKGYTIICPWGSVGVAALDVNDILYTSPSFPPEQIVDTLGAGDTFAAATIFAMAKGMSIELAIDFASRIAGAKVGFFGYDKIKEIFKQFL